MPHWTTPLQRPWWVQGCHSHINTPLEAKLSLLTWQGLDGCDCYLTYQGRALEASSSPAALQLADGAAVQVHLRLR